MSNPSMTKRNKLRIAQQFSRAANTYNYAADVQLDIAFDAIDELPAHGKNGLDIGCGTGRISQQVATKCEQLIAMDLAFGMLTYAKQDVVIQDAPISWIQGDAECLPIADQSLDTVFSSMALQWACDQYQVMSEIARVMAPHASAVLAIMCDGSFYELNDSWRSIDSQRHINRFASADTWYHAAKAQGLQVTMTEKVYVTWHANVRQLLASIKSIGANVLLDDQGPSELSQNGLRRTLNRHTLHHLETNYQQKHAENMQLPLTYKVCFLQCSK